MGILCEVVRVDAAAHLNLGWRPAQCHDPSAARSAVSSQTAAGGGEVLSGPSPMPLDPLEADV